MRNLQYWIRICQKSHNTVTNHNYILCVVRIFMKHTLWWVATEWRFFKYIWWCCVICQPGKVHVTYVVHALHCSAVYTLYCHYCVWAQQSRFVLKLWLRSAPKHCIQQWKHGVIWRWLNINNIDDVQLFSVLNLLLTLWTILQS